MSELKKTLEQYGLMWYPNGNATTDDFQELLENEKKECVKWVSHYGKNERGEWRERKAETLLFSIFMMNGHLTVSKPDLFIESFQISGKLQQLPEWFFRKITIHKGEDRLLVCTVPQFILEQSIEQELLTPNNWFERKTKEGRLKKMFSPSVEIDKKKTDEVYDELDKIKIHIKNSRLLRQLEKKLEKAVLNEFSDEALKLNAIYEKKKEVI